MDRPTPDVTYQGLFLDDAAWAAHLEILRAYLQGAQPVDQDDRAYHEATAAIHGAGLVEDASGAGRNTDFKWCTYRLTPYGRLYAQQRIRE